VDIKEGGIMKRKLFVVYLGITLMLASCIFFAENNTGEREPVYNSSIVWKTEIAGRGSYAENMYSGGCAYIQESSFFMRNHEGGPFCRVVKVRLADGEVMWRTGDIAWDCTDNMVATGGRLFVPASELGLLYVYSDESGELQATVKLGNTDYEAKANGSWGRTIVNSGPYLFWGKRGIDAGLMRFDTRGIDYTLDVSEEQIIEPEKVFAVPDISRAIKNIIEEDGIIYFLTANGRYNFNEGYAILCAMEAETAEVVWRKELPHIDGFIPHSLVINGEYLHVIDMAPSCYRKDTGEAVYEFDDRKRDPQKDPYLSGSSLLAGITIYDNKLYYCTNMGIYFASTLPKGLGNNIICLDAMTGKLVWGDLAGGGSLDTFPVIIKGKAFVLADRGLRVYDARTGRLIGMDENIWNRGSTANYGYGDMFIGFDLDHTTGDGEPEVSHLIAIRAE
jgi:outer membrane protein assembly factor BamB